MAYDDSMIRDVEHFQSRLGKIDGFGDAGEHLMAIVKSKEVEKKAASPPPAAESEGAANGDGQKDTAAEDGAGAADKAAGAKEKTPEPESK